MCMFLLGSKSDSTTLEASCRSRHWQGLPGLCHENPSPSQKSRSKCPGPTRVEEPYFWLRSPGGMPAFPLSRIEGLPAECSTFALAFTGLGRHRTELGGENPPGGPSPSYFADDFQTDLQIIR